MVLVFLCLLCAVVHLFWLVNACFCCVRFSFFSIPSQEIGLGKRLRNDLFCVDRDVKPQLNQSISVSYRYTKYRTIALCCLYDIRRAFSNTNKRAHVFLFVMPKNCCGFCGWHRCTVLFGSRNLLFVREGMSCTDIRITCAAAVQIMPECPRCLQEPLLPQMDCATRYVSQKPQQIEVGLTGLEGYGWPTCNKQPRRPPRPS